MYQQGAVAKLHTDFGYTNAYHTTELNNQLIINGGFNALYDGNSVTELGFMHFPEQMSGSTISNTGSLGVGTYQYIAIFKWIDNNNNLHRSETSQVLTLTTTRFWWNKCGKISYSRA